MKRSIIQSLQIVFPLVVAGLVAWLSRGALSPAVVDSPVSPIGTPTVTPVPPVTVTLRFPDDVDQCNKIEFIVTNLDNHRGEVTIGVKITYVDDYGTTRTRGIVMPVELGALQARRFSVGYDKFYHGIVTPLDRQYLIFVYKEGPGTDPIEMDAGPCTGQPTLTATATSTATPTNSPTPTGTSSPTSTATETVEATATPTASGEWYDVCPGPQDCSMVTVQPTYTPDPTPTCRPTPACEDPTPYPTSTPYPTQPPFKVSDGVDLVSGIMGTAWAGLDDNAARAEIGGLFDG